MLAYADAFGSDWYKNLYPTIKNQPPFLLFAQNFELMSLRDVFEELREIQSYKHWLPDFKMIPFAGDGSGDRYAFYNDGKNEELTIIHWWHDSDHCDIKAKNLQDFIFIKMLNLALEIEVDYDMVAEDDAKLNLNNMLTTHSNYLTNNQATILKEIYSRKFVEEDGMLSAIELDEYEKILLQEIGYCADLGRFVYCKD